MSAKISQQDMIRLASDRSPDAKQNLAEKIGSDVDSDHTDSERQILFDIVRLLASDAETKVRKAISENVQFSSTLPKDIVRMLSSDEGAVSGSFIRSSPLLSDEDLEEIVRRGGEAQVAVADRPGISEEISGLLAAIGEEEAVSALMKNETAQIGESAFLKALDRFGNNESVNGAMAFRKILPLAVSERLVNLVSEKIRDHIVAVHDLPAGVVSDLLVSSREKATAALVSGKRNKSDSETDVLARQMNESGRLTPSLILRLLCMGDVMFLESAMSVKTGVPLTNVRTLIHDPGKLGFRTLCKRAGFTDKFTAALEAVLDVAKETDFDGEEGDIERRKKRMVERVLTHFDEADGIGIPPEDAEYLLSKMIA